MGAIAAVVGAVALVSGLLQTASASSLFQVAGVAPSNTDLTSNPTTPVVGETVVYTATVSDPTNLGPTPTGAVDFKDGTSSMNETAGNCDAKQLTNGAATCTTVQKTAGSHTITATYSGDGHYAQGTPATLAQTVDKADTTTTLQSSDTSAVVTQTVTYTAAVTVDSPGSGPLTGGNVEFQSGGTDIPSCDAVAINTSTGQATCQQTFAASDIGTHSITAIYHGDTSYNDSSASDPVSEAVTSASTTTTLTGTPNPAKTGKTVTYQATVTADSPATGTPGGAVNFKDNGSDISACSNPVTLVNGQASCTITNGYSSAATHPITAVYAPADATYSGSTGAVNEVVNFPYGVSAFITSTSQSDPNNASFRINNGPAVNYTVCVRLASWPSNVVTPPPVNGATKWTVNLNDKCKSVTWKSGSNSTRSLYPDFGFATKGTYVATWHLGSKTGPVIDTDTVFWDSWCPPDALRNQGVWRPSRHKIIDNCRSSSGKIAKNGGRSHLDDDWGLSWSSGLGTLHVELVGRDYYYSNPTTGGKPLLPPPSTGSNVVWWGRYECDTYHGYREFHPPWMQQVNGGSIRISGPQYSTKTPSVSGTWSTHAC